MTASREWQSIYAASDEQDQATVLDRRLQGFVRESYQIEGISLDPVTTLFLASIHRAAIERKTMTAPYLTRTAMLLAGPDIKLRNKPGMNVKVVRSVTKRNAPAVLEVRHHAPLGGPEIRDDLRGLLKTGLFHSPYKLHCLFETLHPFTDGNGRVGRLLWAWAMYQKHGWDFRRPFLQEFYYQSLENHAGVPG